MTDIVKKQTYSVYDLSKICMVSPEQITQWLDEGKLEFFEIAGGHRRVSHSCLEKFLTEHSMPSFFVPAEGESKFKVLVVEDDPDMLEIIGELLADEPRLEIRKEDNGFNAGLQIASWHPDVILLDFIMPGLNGFDVCKKIREHPQTRDIPVLALTSLSTFENRKAVMESGVSDFLGKPFYSESLLRKVRALLGIDKAFTPRAQAA